jgi:hypothetical protein
MSSDRHQKRTNGAPRYEPHPYRVRVLSVYGVPPWWCVEAGGHPHIITRAVQLCTSHFRRLSLCSAARTRIQPPLTPRPTRSGAQVLGPRSSQARSEQPGTETETGQKPAAKSRGLWVGLWGVGREGGEGSSKTPQQRLYKDDASS